MDSKTRLAFFKALPNVSGDMSADAMYKEISKFINDFKDDDEILSEIYDFIADEFVVFIAEPDNEPT